MCPKLPMFIMTPRAKYVSHIHRKQIIPAPGFHPAFMMALERLEPVLLPHCRSPIFRYKHNFTIRPKLSTYGNIPWSQQHFYLISFKITRIKKNAGPVIDPRIACRQIGSSRRDVAHISHISILDCSVTGYPALYS